MAVAGDPDRAETIAQAITDPYHQARALVQVAGVAGMPLARRLAGRAFAVGSWVTPLSVLATLELEVVLQITDDYVVAMHVS